MLLFFFWCLDHIWDHVLLLFVGPAEENKKTCEVEEALSNVMQPICFQSAKRAEGLHEVLAGKGIMLLNTLEFMLERNSF